LGEFSFVGRLLLWAESLRITEIAQLFELLFSLGRNWTLTVTKLGWASFWAIFSKTQLGTLLKSYDGEFSV
jgi:ABC-type uncharacterized transport system permease subunit